MVAGLSEINSVRQAFEAFGDRLETPRRETAAAKGHRASIEACLREKLGMEGFFQSGSYGNGTNVPGFSDVDRFAVFPVDSLSRNSTVVLRRVTVVLRRRFPRTRGIRIKRPAVVIPFGVDGTETTEVVPAYRQGSRNSNAVYEIPSLSGSGWMLSSPDGLHKFVQQLNAATNGRLKRLIKFVKAWKYHKSVPIESFYLELVCALMSRTVVLHSPSIDVARVFTFLDKCKLAEVEDPNGVSGPIGACVASKRSQSLRFIQSAAKISSRAVQSEIEWKFGRALMIWSHLLGNGFPR